MTIREAIGAVVIENGKLLIALKKESWILPGGKPEEGESDVVCLARELREELSGTKINAKTLRYYDSFEGISPNRGAPINVRVYFAELDSILGKPSAEIRDRRFVDYESIRDYNLSSITRNIVEKLHLDRMF